MSKRSKTTPRDIGEAVGMGVVVALGLVVVVRLLTSGAKGVVNGLSEAQEEPESAEKGV